MTTGSNNNNLVGKKSRPKRKYKEPIPEPQPKNDLFNDDGNTSAIIRSLDGTIVEWEEPLTEESIPDLMLGLLPFYKNAIAHLSSIRNPTGYDIKSANGIMKAMGDYYTNYRLLVMEKKRRNNGTDGD